MLDFLKAAILVAAVKLQISRGVATLATSTLYLCGYAFGPLVWAPLPEIKGRKLPAILSIFVLCLSAVGSATAKDTQTVMICRFFRGLYGSGPIVIAPGTIAETYNPLKPSYALGSFAVTVFMGLLFSPFISGSTLQNSALGWQWTFLLGHLRQPQRPPRSSLRHRGKLCSSAPGQQNGRHSGQDRRLGLPRQRRRAASHAPRLRSQSATTEAIHRHVQLFDKRAKRVRKTWALRGSSVIARRIALQGFSVKHGLLQRCWRHRSVGLDRADLPCAGAG